MTSSLQVMDLEVVVGEQVILPPTTFALGTATSIAVMGPSGSGKSTLLSCVSGGRAPTAGTVVVGDVDLCRLPRSARASWRRDRVGLIQQDPHLLEELTVRENVGLILAFRGDRRDVSSVVDEILAHLGIGDLRDRSIADLSGGERQRVSIARGLVNARDLLVADEPTASLDRANADVVAAQLVDAAAAVGAPLVLATHDPSIAQRCDAILDLRGGR